MATAPSDLPKDEAKCVAPIPVPTHGPGGVFSVACSTTIAAPPLACLEKVLDLSGYPEWNTFIPKASVASAAPTPTGEDSLAPELQTLAARPGYAAPGAKLRFDAVMSPGASPRKVDIEVTFLEAFEVSSGGDAGKKRRGYRVAWKATGMPHFLLHSERVQEFVEGATTSSSADGSVETTTTEYACWETFGGVLGYVLPRAQLEDGFMRWMSGLKKATDHSVLGEKKSVILGAAKPERSVTKVKDIQKGAFPQEVVDEITSTGQKVDEMGGGDFKVKPLKLPPK
ncbi:hypothetical protein F5Y19DRAFT_470863 [Xylariaceae sp. FL1651]|nr:hypothetical protein F5Y19DRAFT_470863 [Xylariaceae sp. FL1651]